MKGTRKRGDMNTPITIDSILAIIGVIVAVEGLFKALEWFIGKITSQHDKTKKIDTTEGDLNLYIAKTDGELAKLKLDMKSAHDYATMSLQNLEKSITHTLKEHKEEYMSKIESVETSITNMQAIYQQTVAVMELKIDNLEKATTKHNNLIDRMYAVEKKTDLQEEQIKVANHRINDLEKKQ